MDGTRLLGGGGGRGYSRPPAERPESPAGMKADGELVSGTTFRARSVQHADHKPPLPKCVPVLKFSVDACLMAVEGSQPAAERASSSVPKDCTHRPRQEPNLREYVAVCSPDACLPALRCSRVPQQSSHPSRRPHEATAEPALQRTVAGTGCLALNRRSQQPQLRLDSPWEPADGACRTVTRLGRAHGELRRAASSPGDRR